MPFKNLHFVFPFTGKLCYNTLTYDRRHARAPDGRLLARDVRLTVRAGEKLLLCGRNGAGKSTPLHPLTARRAGAMLSASINKR